MSWCTIESDPGVFNEMIWRLGASKLAIKEIYNLTDIDVSDASYGLIFLFKWLQEPDSRPVVSDENLGDLFFAKQVATNACATQAILSILLNADNIDMDPRLSDFKSFVSLLDSESRGMAIENADFIRDIHNSFSRPEPFLNDDVKAENSEKEDAHHFIAFIPFQGKVYELDGLKDGPIEVGQVSVGDNWLSIVRPVIEQRMARYAESETQFALLSVGKRRRNELEEQILLLQTQLETLTGDDSGEVAAILTEQIENSKIELGEEVAAEERQKQENIRRRHNYVPFIVSLLRHLAQNGKMIPLVEASRAKARGGAQSTK